MQASQPLLMAVKIIQYSVILLLITDSQGQPWIPGVKFVTLLPDEAVNVKVTRDGKYHCDYLWKMQTVSNHCLMLLTLL